MGRSRTGPHSVGGEGLGAREDPHLRGERWAVGGAWNIGRSLRGFALQYAQFAVVGLMNTVIDLGGLNVLLAIWPTTNKLGLLAENSVAVVLAIINSYIWNTRWTFRRQADGSSRQMIFFLGQSLLNVAINDAVLVVMANFIWDVRGWPVWLTVNLAKGFAMVMASSASFLVMRMVVFQRRHAHGR